MIDDLLLVGRDGRIATVTLNRMEKRNAVNQQMGEHLAAILRDLGSDPGVSVIVIRGAGREAFCAGADIGEMARAGTPRKVGITAEASTAIANCPKPVIAMIFGYAMGGGCSLAAACDLRLLGRSAKMGVPAARLGVVYTVEATTRLVDLIGPARTSQLLFTGKAFDAQTCLAMGLADAVYPDEDLEAETYALAQHMAENAPLSLAGAKRIIVAYLSDPSLKTAPEVFGLSAEAFASDDHREGKLAFLEKRKPVFRGV